MAYKSAIDHVMPLLSAAMIEGDSGVRAESAHDRLVERSEGIRDERR